MDISSFPRQIAYARLAYAAAAMLTPKAATVMVGGKPSEMTPMAMGWAGVFAAREGALAAVSLGSEQADPATRRKVLLLNAAVDTLDSLSFLVLAKRQRSLMPVLLGAPGAVFSAYSHFRAAQEISAAPGPAAYEPVYASA
jgi:hypothetical protein